MNRNTFASPSAQDRMASIVKFLDGHQATVAELAAHIGVAEATIGNYLRWMAVSGEAHCVKRAGVNRGQPFPAIWTAGATVDAPASGFDSQCVVVRKVWAGPVPRMFEPMACLFGRAA